MSERLYSLVLRLYPRAFHERYADEMMRVFRERLRDEGLVRVWVDVLADAAVSIPSQHFHTQRPHPMFPPSAAPLKRAVIAKLSRSFLAGGVLGVCIPAAFLFPSIRPLAVLLTIASLVFQARTVHKARAIKTYRVDVGGDYVTVACEAIGLSPLTLARNEVIGLQLFGKAGMRVHAADPSRDLWVPSSVPGYANVRERLRQWAPVKEAFRLTGLAGDTPGPLGLAIYSLLLGLLPFWFVVGIASGVVVQVGIAVLVRVRAKTLPPRRVIFISTLTLLVLLLRWLW